MKLGWALLKLGRTREAALEFEQAVSLAPDFFDAQAGLGNIYVKTGQYKKALGPLGRALSMQPDNFVLIDLMKEARSNARR